MENAGQFSESNLQVLEATNVCMGEWVIIKHCPSGKLIMAELAHNYRYKNMKTEKYINKFWVAM